jgi:hypothetical protein
MPKYASFLIPVIDGEIYLGQRNTQPYKGFFGAIGGKSDPSKSTELPHLIEKPGGRLQLSIADRIAQQEGREFPGTTAVREFWEEVFNASCPEEGELTDRLRLGLIVDTAPDGTAYHCHFHLANVHRKDIHLSQRELSAFLPLRDIPSDRIFPISQIALEEVRWRCTTRLPNFSAYESLKHDQIPEFRTLPYRNTGMIGAHIQYGAQQECYDNRR